MDLQQVKQDADNGSLISTGTWQKVLAYALDLEESLAMNSPHGPIETRTRALLENWLAMVHDNGQPIGNRLQNLSNAINSLLEGKSASELLPFSITQPVSVTDHVRDMIDLWKHGDMPVMVRLDHLADLTEAYSLLDNFFAVVSPVKRLAQLEAYLMIDSPEMVKTISEAMQNNIDIFAERADSVAKMLLMIIKTKIAEARK